MTCKQCGKDYHYCPSCGKEDDYLEENFCSPDCKRITDPEYKSFDEKIYGMNSKSYKLVKPSKMLK